MAKLRHVTLRSVLLVAIALACGACSSTPDPAATLECRYRLIGFFGVQKGFRALVRGGDFHAIEADWDDPRAFEELSSEAPTHWYRLGDRGYVRGLGDLPDFSFSLERLRRWLREGCETGGKCDADSDIFVSPTPPPDAECEVAAAETIVLPGGAHFVDVEDLAHSPLRPGDR